MSFATFESTSWPQSVIQLLDDHHLVVLSDRPRARQQFGSSLGDHLRTITDTHVVTIDGAAATDLPSFCRQLVQGLLLPKIKVNPWWRDMQSVIEVLRSACTGFKRRYLIWQDADAMLESDVELFCRLVNAMFGVAAECEHISLDPVMLQRVVFIGGAKLGAYAEDVNGQFCRWLDDDEQDSPFWEVMSVVERPPVIAYRLEG